jgi:hypothetical protein
MSLSQPSDAWPEASALRCVGYGAYAALRPGDRVCVLEHHGAIGLPWVTARLCDR